MRTILLAGQDSVLLATRAAVLRMTGSEVVCASVKEAQKLIESSRFDLLVLCHSVAFREAERLAELARKQSRTIKVLLVSNLGGVRQDRGEKFDAMSVPEP